MALLTSSFGSTIPNGVKRVRNAFPTPEVEAQLSLEDARVAVSDAIKLQGNASAQISKLRRKKILKAVNPDIQDLAEEDIIQEAAPNLFGREFEDKMKASKII